MATKQADHAGRDRNRFEADDGRTNVRVALLREQGKADATEGQSYPDHNPCVRRGGPKGERKYRGERRLQEKAMRDVAVEHGLSPRRTAGRTGARGKIGRTSRLVEADWRHGR